MNCLLDCFSKKNLDLNVERLNMLNQTYRLHYYDNLLISQKMHLVMNKWNN